MGGVLCSQTETSKHSGLPVGLARLKASAGPEHPGARHLGSEGRRCILTTNGGRRDVDMHTSKGDTRPQG